jgi:hypothetical protein
MNGTIGHIAVVIRPAMAHGFNHAGDDEPVGNPPGTTDSTHRSDRARSATTASSAMSPRFARPHFEASVIA